MSDETAITIYQGGELALDSLRRYGDDLARAGQVADALSREDTFKLYHAEKSENTITAQKQALHLFSAYLEEAHVMRDADDLLSDAQAWRGMSEGLVKGFRAWLVNKGYRIGSINHRLAIVRQYCTLAHTAGMIDTSTHELIMTVNGFSAKAGINLDRDRTREGKLTTLSTKKALPALVLTGQEQQLKTETTHPARPFTRGHDKQLEARDALLMGLLIEHAFRVSEVAGLKVDNFDLHKGVVTVYRSKTNDTQTHKLMKHTRQAAERYITHLARKSGPLFTGYKEKPITRQGIFDRVRQLGEQIGIENLSPHDLRHYWTYDALNNGTPLDRVQSGGNWTTCIGYFGHPFEKETSLGFDGPALSPCQMVLRHRSSGKCFLCTRENRRVRAADRQGRHAYALRKACQRPLQTRRSELVDGPLAGRLHTRSRFRLPSSSHGAAHP